MINHVEDCRELPLRDGRFYNPLSPDESGTDPEEPTTELPNSKSPTEPPSKSPPTEVKKEVENTNDLIDRNVIDRGDIKPPSIIISRDEIPDDHWEIDAPDNIQTKGKRAFSFFYRLVLDNFRFR